jgi:hypothetical protein
MNMFLENDGAMMKEDNEQGGGRNVRRMGQTLLEEQAIPPEDSLLDSTISPSTPHACMEIEIDFSLLAKGDNVDSQYYKHLGLTVSAAGGWNGSSATSL